MRDKLEFSQRLRDLMVAAGHEPSAKVIENAYARHAVGGRPISHQTAWNWLNAKALPTQDKLLVLAEWLKVEPHVLRYGQQVSLKVREYRKRREDLLTYDEREAFDAYLQLPAPQRKVVREVILTFAKVYPPTGEASPET